MSCNLTCNSGLPCRVQGDNDRVRFVVGLTIQRLDWCPSFKLAHYKYFRVRWVSFKSSLPFNVLFININALGEGKQDNFLNTSANTTTSSTVASAYTVSMPIEQNIKTSFDYTADNYGWIPLPNSVNLKKFTMFGYCEGTTAGDAPANFITPANPVVMELEFSNYI